MRGRNKCCSEAKHIVFNIRFILHRFAILQYIVCPYHKSLSKARRGKEKDQLKNVQLNRKSYFIEPAEVCSQPKREHGSTAQSVTCMEAVPYS